MQSTGIKVEISPGMIEKLAPGREKLFLAAHADGSDNRINSDVILEASSYGTGFGIIAAAAQWIRKRFRNRGKTRLDLEAEKEAAKINRTCGALEEMLFEYFLHAREGSVDPEALGELTGVLREVTEYSRAGKLLVPGEKDLEAMCAAAAGITAALSGGKPLPPPQETEGTDAFSRMLDQLLLQSQLLTGTSPD